MALRAAIVYLLTAILLACPYFCLSNAGAGSGRSSIRSENSGGCKCCSHPAPQDSKDRPSQPDSRKGSGTCLCHGAVVNQHVEMPNLDEAVVAYLSLDSLLPAPQPFAIERSSLSDLAACHFPAADSGREVRALIESLLL
jgi:hypothetical protein